jgi:hypothetical protein
LREALAAADPFSPMRDPAMTVIWESYVAEYFQGAPCEPTLDLGYPVVPMTCAVADR